MSVCGSCTAEIVWAVTEKGNRIPIDAKAPAGGGNIRLVFRRGDDPLAFQTNPGDGMFVSHFVTCPNAAAHRKTPAQRSLL